MLVSLLLLILGLVLLYFGAEWLVGGSAALAIRAGVSPVVAGLTIVAYGTSMPELVVSLKAALSGQSGLALGNVVGSNIFNIGMILGIAAVVFPMRVESRLVRWDIPFMILLSVAFSWMLLTGMVERWMGFVLVGILLSWTAWEIHSARSGKEKKLEEGMEAVLPDSGGKVWKHVLAVVAGIALLALGGRWLVDGGVGLARGFGISETVIGLTIIAAGTSAPELAATLVAALKKEADIAVGNIVGSNIFNILSVAGFASVIHPLDSTSISGMDLAAMLLLAVVVLPLARTGFVLQRWEGALLLLIYCVYFSSLWF